MAKTSTRHLPEADDRFVEALLEEHARLGGGDDIALLALIRARTEEQPESGHTTSSSQFGLRQWLQVAAVVTLIGIALTVAFRHFTPGSASTNVGNRVAASPTDSSTDDTFQPPEYTIRIKNVTAASDSAPLITGNGMTNVGDLFTADWQSPLPEPLSIIPVSQDLTVDASGAMSLEEMQSLLAAGNFLPNGAVSVSGLLEQLPLTKPESSETAVQLSAANCPWNKDHQLVHLSADSLVAKQASSRFPQHGDLSIPVLSRLVPSTANGLDRELIRAALAQFTETALGKESPQLVIEFNPAQVSNYRLLGCATNFEGQLTALFEIRNADRTISGSESHGNDLKYQPTNASNDLLTAQFGAEESNLTRAQTCEWQQANGNLQLTAAATLFANMVNSDQTPSQEMVNLVNRLLNGQTNAAPEVERLRNVILLWGKAAGLDN